MDKIENYIRVGTDYYKIIEYPSSKDYVIRLERWSYSNLITDFGKSKLKLIQKYDAFCNIPAHIDYKRVYKNCYNKYEPLNHQPKAGSWDNTKNFLEHIFGEQYHLGLDYIKVLYRYPTQCLPILCLVSEERKTGKSTFVYWLKDIYGYNMTINTNDEFRSRFNNDWIGKLIISVEETLLDKIEDTERIKQLSTGKNAKEESKGINKKEVEFNGKFILSSNNERTFIKIDEHETRFWVLKIPTLLKEDTQLMDKMKAEIPAFLAYLIQSEIETPKTTRTWFDETLLKTKALERVVGNNQSFIEKELVSLILNTLLDFNLTEIEYSNKDLLSELKSSGIKVSSFQLGEILRDKFELEPSTSKTYNQYSWSGFNGEEKVITDSKRGRVYKFVKEKLQKLVVC